MSAARRSSKRKAPCDANEMLRLNGSDADVFLRAVASPPKPAPRLIQALKGLSGE